MGEGKEGDWDCSGCRNRNYAFRSYCNRCKQPRLLVDSKTPVGSKWLPRIGDWICSGCTNNNYASREKCKKCGQAKEVAAFPAIAIPGASHPPYPHYFARAPGVDQKINIGLIGNALQHLFPPGSNWSVGPDSYGLQAPPTWPLGSQLVPKGWRNGDWLCNCGFHNYASRSECKKCSASMPPALGTKRLASDDSVYEWDNKRLNAGQTNVHQLSYLKYDAIASSFSDDQEPGIYAPFNAGTSAGSSNSHVNMSLPPLGRPSAVVGKGAKQWRDGDWMCSDCDNHNYASRAQCNRCYAEKVAPAEATDGVV